MSGEGDRAPFLVHKQLFPVSSHGEGVMEFLGGGVLFNEAQTPLEGSTLRS